MKLQTKTDVYLHLNHTLNLGRCWKSTLTCWFHRFGIWVAIFLVPNSTPSEKVEALRWLDWGPNLLVDLEGPWKALKWRSPWKTRFISRVDSFHFHDCRKDCTFWRVCCFRWSMSMSSIWVQTFIMWPVVLYLNVGESRWFAWNICCACHKVYWNVKKNIW